MSKANGAARGKYGLPSGSGASSSTQEQSKGSGSPKRKLSEPDITSGACLPAPGCSNFWLTGWNELVEIVGCRMISLRDAGFSFDAKPQDGSQPAPAAPKAAPLFGKFGLGPAASPGKKPHFSFAAPPPGNSAEASSPRQLFSFGRTATTSRLAQSSRQPAAPGGDGLPGSSLAAAAIRFTQQIDAQKPLPAVPVSSENHPQHDSLAKAAQAFDKQVGGPPPADNRARQAQSSSQHGPGAQAGTNSHAEEGALPQVRDHGKLEQERSGQAGASGERAASGAPLPAWSAGFAFGQGSWRYAN